MAINYFVANAVGTLDQKLDLITATFDGAKRMAAKSLKADKIDIIFVDAPDNTIPQLGCGGYTASANLIYIFLDSTFPIKELVMEATLLHEMHHAIRWRRPGYGKTLGEVMISEGLAALYEEEMTGVKPIYVSVKYDKKCIQLALKELDNVFNYYGWFTVGNNDVPRWFGYSFGYKKVKQLSEKMHKTPSQLVNMAFKIYVLSSNDIELKIK